MVAIKTLSMGRGCVGKIFAADREICPGVGWSATDRVSSVRERKRVIEKEREKEKQRGKNSLTKMQNRFSVFFFFYKKAGNFGAHAVFFYII